MDEGVNHLAGGQARAARDDQRRAAELLERGADFAEDVAAALRRRCPMAMRGPLLHTLVPATGGPHGRGTWRGCATRLRRASQELDQEGPAARASGGGP